MLDIRASQKTIGVEASMMHTSSYPLIERHGGERFDENVVHVEAAVVRPSKSRRRAVTSLLVKASAVKVEP